jgi:plastocyanin
VITVRSAIATIVLGVSLLTACSAEAAGDVSAGPGGPDAVRVVAIDNAFEPARVELAAGQEVEIEIANEGGTTHDFTSEALELSTGPIDPGAAATARFVVPDGETAFRCSLHGGMEGTIVGA